MNQDANYIFSPIKEEITCYHITTENNLINPVSPYHRHDAYEIYLFLRGNTNMYLEQSCFKLMSGDLIIINPSEMHRYVCLDNQIYERIRLNIKKTILEKLSSRRSNLLSCFESHSLGQNNLMRLSQDQIIYFRKLTENLNSCLGSVKYGQDILAESYVTQLLVFINTLYQASTYNSNNIMPELVSKTMSYIKDHLTESISSEQMERELHYSGKYISQQFKEHTGLTIRAYIVDQRVSVAKNYLSTGKTVAEACELSGFSDYANFIRSFKKIVGMPPGKYKANKQAY